MEKKYAKQQSNCPRTLTDMYKLLVAFEPTRVTPVSGGRNKGLHFGNLVAKYEVKGNGDHGGDGVTGRKL